MSKNNESSSSRVRLNSYNDAKSCTNYILQKNPAWKDVVITNGTLTVDDIKEILKALEENKFIKSLCLSRNKNIGDEGAAEVAKFLADNTTLESVDLSDCNVADKGFSYLSNALCNNTHLKKLFINLNQATEDGADCMAAMLNYNKTLKSLEVGANEFGKEGFEKIIDVFIAGGNKTLTELGLSESLGLGKYLAEVDAVIKSSGSKTRYSTDADSLVGFEVGIKATEKVVELIKKNRSLKSLKLNLNLLDEKKIFGALKSNKSITNLELGFEGQPHLITNSDGVDYLKKIEQLIERNKKSESPSSFFSLFAHKKPPQRAFGDYHPLLNLSENNQTFIKILAQNANKLNLNREQVICITEIACRDKGIANKEITINNDNDVIAGENDIDDLTKRRFSGKIQKSCDKYGFFLENEPYIKDAEFARCPTRLMKFPLELLEFLKNDISNENFEQIKKEESAKHDNNNYRNAVKQRGYCRIC
jgi:Ran GTPase-activating protein (RanGAP) involved in mRNA processing and transport